jgi:hypothetical protein
MPTHTLKKKPQSPRAALQSEYKALTRQLADDKRIAEKAATKLAKDARREIDRLNAIAWKATATAAATQLRYDKAASQLARIHSRSNTGLHRRIAILESRLAAL